MRTHKGQRFVATTELTPAAVAAFARSIGDPNPLHHDECLARRSRFGQRIASGPQTSALLMAATADHFSRTGPMLGLRFAFRFRRAVPARQRVRVEWLVVAVRPSARLGGDIVELRGRLQTEDGRTAVGASGTVLLTPRP